MKHLAAFFAWLFAAPDTTCDGCHAERAGWHILNAEDHTCAIGE